MTNISQPPTQQEEPNDPPTIYKCPSCPCIFFTQHDLHRHRQTFGAGNHNEEYTATHKRLERDQDTDDSDGWFLSKNEDGSWLKLADKDLKLKNQLRQQGTTRMGKYTYSLSNNQKWLIKKPAGAT